ncbi:PPOX class F420-dependent oxidoreductase [Nonomuraea insulae]|uniref:PPOX class F420-dependent oxidoreductase n=1 Tax=Nonomuraea insulae TaxID=1616787 RepID=A0ABW1D0H4_9ACTN
MPKGVITRLTPSVSRVRLSSSTGSNCSRRMYRGISGASVIVCFPSPAGLDGIHATRKSIDYYHLTADYRFGREQAPSATPRPVPEIAAERARLQPEQKTAAGRAGQWAQPHIVYNETICYGPSCGNAEQKTSTVSITVQKQTIELITMTDHAYGPGQGPGARPLTEEEAAQILDEQSFGVLATLKRDGRPHLGSMAVNWNAGERMIRIASTQGRIKVRHLRNDPRATVHVQGDNVLTYAVAEGDAEVSEVSTTPGDATGRELLKMNGGFADPVDEAAFLDRMVKDQRLVIRLRVTRLYGIALDVPPEN